MLGSSCATSTVPWTCAGGYPLVHPGVSPAAALAAEAVYTFALATVVLNVATTRANDGNSFYGLVIGFMVLGGAVAAGRVSGGAFNPAVGTALPVVHRHASDAWVYWIGPCAGAGLAALVFRFVTCTEDEEKRPLVDELESPPSIVTVESERA